jgi:hypothetical protein
MRRALDAESLGVLPKAKVNHYMRLEHVAEVSREARNCLPLGRKNARMQLTVEV